MITPKFITVGIDLGALNTKVTLGPTHDHELVRNAHGGHITPTAVTFAGKHRARLIGEDAAEVSRADGNTVAMLERLLVDSLNSVIVDEGSNEDVFAEFRRFDWRKEKGIVYIPSMDEEFTPTALLAMLLGRIKRNVLSTVERLDGGKKDVDKSTGADFQFVFAVPPSYPDSTRNALVDAAYAASISNSKVIDSTCCMATIYERKFGGAVAENEKKNILVVDMGHARTCVTILQLVKKVELEEDAMDVDEEIINEEEKKVTEPIQGTEKSVSMSKVKILSCVSCPILGAGNIDILLYRHFLGNHPALTDAQFQSNSRSGQRLLEGCRKLKHLLSMLPEGNVAVETIGKNEMDVTLSASREVIKQVCQEEVVNKLKNMIKDALDGTGGVDAMGEEGISVVELTGGGCRIPMIQDAIRDVIGKAEDFAFLRSFDDTSLALGAAMTPYSVEVQTIDAEREEKRTKLLDNEVAMVEKDEQLRRKDEIRNQIESHILELRSARLSSAHSSLLPKTDDFHSFLDGTDDWLFSDECEEATVEQMIEKWTQIQTRTLELCGDYLAAKQSEADKKDREMEEEARRAAAERDAEAAMNGDDGDEADHDTRRLPTKRRMEIVMKNKAEANELFSGGNYRHAAARYAKALTHCTKFYDLSPQDEQEVNDVKLSLYLNMAFSYIKLEKFDNAFASCNDALSIDPQNVKALYRRATVQYEKRKFDDALKDLKEAEKLAPDDKAVKKLKLMVDKQMAKQKAKEKAMAKKMFG
ncbi:hypothetical protein ACHAXS_009915 [Conticribra weissflogii]